MKLRKKKRWKPRVGEKFWYFFGSLDVEKIRIETRYDIYDDWMGQAGCFRVKCEAQAALRKIKKILVGGKIV